MNTTELDWIKGVLNHSEMGGLCIISSIIVGHLYGWKFSNLIMRGIDETNGVDCNCTELCRAKLFLPSPHKVCYWKHSNAW